MSRQIIRTAEAPASPATYSQAVKGETIQEQTRSDR